MTDPAPGGFYDTPLDENPYRQSVDQLIDEYRTNGQDVRALPWNLSPAHGDIVTSKWEPDIAYRVVTVHTNLAGLVPAGAVNSRPSVWINPDNLTVAMTRRHGVWLDTRPEDSND